MLEHLMLMHSLVFIDNGDSSSNTSNMCFDFVFS